jgi:hypothetical protein
LRANTRRVLWCILLLGAVAALWVAGERWRAEAANRGVEIVLDWDEVRSLSSETGAPIGDTLRGFYQAGARGVAIGEQSVGEMQSLRRVDLLPPEEATASNLPAEVTTRIRVSDPVLRQRIVTHLLHKWGLAVAPDGDVLTIPAGWPDVAGLTIGFPADVIAFVRAHHMEPVLRVSNFTNADADSIAWVADQLVAAHGRLVIFGGDQVIGFPDGVKQAAVVWQTRHLVFGQVEFGKQKGEDALASALKGDIVRVHSISPAEMGRMSEADAVDRFLRAAEERNLRALYVRLLPGAPVPAVESNVGYVNHISRALKDHGMSVRFAAPFRPYESSPIARCVIGLGVAAATLLLVLYMWPLAGVGLNLVLALAVLDIFLPVLGIGRKVVALQAALLLPVLAFLVLRSVLERREPEATTHPLASVVEPDEPRSLFQAVWRGIPAFLGVSLLSALGALFVVGLLSSRMATVKITAFSGIKAQQAGAILIVAAIYYLDISSRGGLAAARARVKSRALAIWNQPMTLGAIVIGLVAIIALAFLLARSGNDPGVGVSGIELRFRALLDRLLLVRPRTKEFLIGHPALLLGIALAAFRRPKWALPILVVGAIGQVSIVNTFCHLHTPLGVSLLRVVNGLWTGIVVALVVAWVLDRIWFARPAQVESRRRSA